MRTAAWETDSSERLLQRGSGERSVYKILVKRELNTMKCLCHKRFSASHEELMLSWRDIGLFQIWRDTRTGIMKSVPLSKHLFCQIRWSTKCLTPPAIPSGGVEGQQLQQHRVQSPQRQMAKALVQSLAALFHSVQSSHSVISDSLWPRGLQHARLSCTSPTPGAYSNSYPSSWWCHPTIWSFVVPFSSSLQSFPASGSFPLSQLFAWGGQSMEFQRQYQSFQWTPRTGLL